MLELMTQLMRNQPAPPPNPMVPWRFGEPQVLQQDLTDIGFADVVCTPYSHPMVWAWPDLVKFVLVPNGQLQPLLQKLKAGAQRNIDQEAEQVSQPASSFSNVQSSSQLHVPVHIWLHLSTAASVYCAVRQSA